MKNKKYNVYDEYDRLIDEGVDLKRAKSTVKENPGSTIRSTETCKQSKH